MIEKLCPSCQFPVPCATHATSPEKRMPKDGDLSFCIYCGEWSIFTLGGLGLRMPTESEDLEIKNNPDAFLVFEAWLSTKQDRPAN